MKAILSLFACLTMAASAMPTSDAAGAKDYPGIPRYEGSKILTQSEQKFGEILLQTAGLSAPNSTDPKEVRPVSGALHRTTYALANTPDERRTVLEVFKNYEQALKDAGFTTIWTGDQGAIRNGPPAVSYFPEADRKELFTGIKERRYLAAEKGGLFAVIFVAERQWDHTFRKADPSNSFKADLKLPAGTIMVQADFINTTPMEEKMVLVKAEEMENKISDTGRIALYGIHFDFNKADLKPESEPTIGEIVKLLKDSPSLKLLVVGHTDNVGTFEFNQDLSQRRAATVVKELTSKHGVAAGRLSAHGASFISPVATNKTDEGKALNRRVELVEQ
ncbi:MAG: OmpA family protein [Akkermansiaceae bacterium]|nr:OmpA family protein [Akkermansiaceae bacterium]